MNAATTYAAMFRDDAMGDAFLSLEALPTFFMHGLLEQDEVGRPQYTPLGQDVRNLMEREEE
jgi:hypothetical protein